MTDWNDIRKIRLMDRMCEALGFRYQPDAYGTNTLSLFAKEELSVYATNSALYQGNVDDVLNWLNGWERAHQYLEVLGVATPKRIERSKIDYRNKRLVKMIKGEEDAKTEL